MEAILFVGDRLAGPDGVVWEVAQRDAFAAELVSVATSHVRFIWAVADAPYGTYELPWGFSLLDRDSPLMRPPKCTCGGAALRHPSHSAWCDVLPNAPAPHDNAKRRLF